MKIKMENKSEKKPSFNSIYTPKKPKIVKRFAAWIVDIILIIVVATGISWITSIACNYDKTQTAINEKYVQYDLATYDEKTKEYIIVTEEEYKANLEYYQGQEAKMAKDEVFLELYAQRNIYLIVIPSVGIFTSLLIFELIIPLILKHGRTIGMRFFGIGYVTEDDLDVGFKQVFVRFIFGKTVLETGIPLAGYFMFILIPGYELIGILLLTLIPLGNLIFSIVEEHKRGVHDYIAKVKPCDNDCQIYVKSAEELAKLRIKENA